MNRIAAPAILFFCFFVGGSGGAHAALIHAGSAVWDRHIDEEVHLRSSAASKAGQSGRERNTNDSTPSQPGNSPTGEAPHAAWQALLDGFSAGGIGSVSGDEHNGNSPLKCHFNRQRLPLHDTFGFRLPEENHVLPAPPKRGIFHPPRCRSGIRSC